MTGTCRERLCGFRRRVEEAIRLRTPAAAAACLFSSGQFFPLFIIPLLPLLCSHLLNSNRNVPVFFSPAVTRFLCFVEFTTLSVQLCIKSLPEYCRKSRKKSILRFFKAKRLAQLLVCVQVMVAEALDISRETYFAILMDRSYNGPVMVGSPQGGVDIEEVAATNPELIFKVQNVCHLRFIKCKFKPVLF